MTVTDNTQPETPLTIREAGRLLGVHYNTVKRIHPSDLPFFRVGQRGDRRYRPADVRAYIAARLENQ